jgi:hypothetical protein
MFFIAAAEREGGPCPLLRTTDRVCGACSAAEVNTMLQNTKLVMCRMHVTCDKPVAYRPTTSEEHQQVYIDLSSTSARKFVSAAHWGLPPED